MELSLAEQVLLLAYDDETGRPGVTLTNLDYGVTGALLLDLSFANRLTVQRGQIWVTDRAETGDPILDPMLHRVGYESRHHSVDWWIYRLASPDHREALLARLIDRGLLVREKHRVLGIFPGRDRFPETDRTPKEELVKRLHDLIDGTEQPDPRSVELLAVVHACGLDRDLFPDIDRDLLRHRIAELTRKDYTGHSVGNVIGAMNNAVLAAVGGGFVFTPPDIALS